MTTPCPFCALELDQLVWASETVVVLRDRSPVAPGHTLVIPKRHVETIFEVTPAEHAELWQAVERVKAELDARYSPDGYNVGFNAGAAAGQTVMHGHIHVIPRHGGDMPDPRGGVRGVIPGKQRAELATPSPGLEPRMVVGGTEDPLLEALAPALDGAQSVDLAVAFIFDGGVRLLKDRLLQVLQTATGRIRIVTGDYQDVTEPEALRHLLSLQTTTEAGAHAGTLELRAFRVPRGKGASFHPKAWILRGAGVCAAWVGSSNMSATALATGVEWNVQLVERSDVGRVAESFEALWNDPRTELVDDAWVRAYEARRRPPTRGGAPLNVAVGEDAPAPVPTPRAGVQAEALRKLEQTRERGNRSGLVVLATGLGKTFLSAFDSRDFERVLFVAHREEILTQALETFRRVRPKATLGLLNGNKKQPDAELLFASVQTLSETQTLESFAPDRFDYIVVDEFHHAAAQTYRQVLDHFEPQFMLGLTATPERLDGVNLLGLCEGNEVYRADISRGIADKQLAPFRYFGIGDAAQYERVPWRSVTDEMLTELVATQARAEHALQTLRTHTKGRVRALGFCVTKRHADFMAKVFSEQGVQCAAVYTESSAKRVPTLEKLASGALEIVFCVDMFNEGVDVPSIDTVFMLRPTQSSIIWLQQLGRGLRYVEGKTLTVLDYIGNHGVFLQRPQGLLAALNISVVGKHEPWEVAAYQAQLPPGVHVHFDLAAQDVLASLREASSRAGTKPLRWYQEFRDAYGRRPSAREAEEAGWFTKLRKPAGGWFEAIAAQGNLSQEEAAVLEAHGALLRELETLPHEESPLLLSLTALLQHSAFPAAVNKRELCERISSRVCRSAVLMRDLGIDASEPQEVRRRLDEGAFSALCKLGGGNVFRDRPRTIAAPGLLGAPTAAVVSMIRELVELQFERYFKKRSKSVLLIPPILDDRGGELDARFDVEEIEGQTTLIVHSRGGARGSGAERNTQYREGLVLLLGRLHREESTIVRIEVDSTKVHRGGLNAAARTVALGSFEYPVEMKDVQDPAALARAIGVGMKRVGQAPGKTGGNDTKRIRIFLRDHVDPGALWHRLRSLGS